MKAKKKLPELTAQELREVWYRKLERSGFEDIESDEYKLKQYSQYFCSPVANKDREAKSEYYSMAGRFLHDYKFKNNLEKVIWEYHSHAISMRNIAKTLNKTRVRKFNKDNVHAILKPLIKEMKRLYLVSDKN